MEDYKPVFGKTYSLFGQDTATAPFYQKISVLSDEVLTHYSLPAEEVLESIRSLSRKKRKLRAAASKSTGSSELTDLMHRMDQVLGEHLTALPKHLRELSPHTFITDRELFCSREQYFLYLLEFELVNRVNKARFQDADFRIALLPYCLKEIQTLCRARPDEIDYACSGCLKTCYINRVSRVLRDHDVHPYIWSRGSLRTMFGKLVRKHGSIGVLGIACIVELIRGMRYCSKARLPVMGIPLNANRCPRWMGGFFNTSVDIMALEKTLK